MPPSPSPVPVIDLGGDMAPEPMAESVRRTLGASPQRWLSPTWFYDDLGSALFDAITRLDAYYPTRRERAVLEERAGEIAALTGADTLIELGSGTSEKTRILLDAFSAAGTLRRFVPVDVSEATMTAAAAAIEDAHPGVEVVPVVGDLLHDLHRLPTGGRRLIAFLGSTIGNLTPVEQTRFLTRVAGTLRPGEGLLLGTDLVKDVDRLLAAYDDPIGVTAAFNRNVLAVLNRELGADFDLRGWAHEARWDATRERIEMHLVARRACRVQVPASALDLDFAAGESIQTEISAKFRLDTLAALMVGAGLRLDVSWTDPHGDVALSLATVPT